MGKLSHLAKPSPRSKEKPTTPAKSEKLSKAKPRSESKSRARPEEPLSSPSPTPFRKSASSTVSLRQPDLKTPLTFYPYQKSGIEHRSRLKIVTKGRRIG